MSQQEESVLPAAAIPEITSEVIRATTYCGFGQKLNKDGEVIKTYPIVRSPKGVLPKVEEKTSTEAR